MEIPARKKQSTSARVSLSISFSIRPIIANPAHPPVLRAYEKRVNVTARNGRIAFAFARFDIDDLARWVEINQAVHPVLLTRDYSGVRTMIDVARDFQPLGFFGN